MSVELTYLLKRHLLVHSYIHKFFMYSRFYVVFLLKSSKNYLNLCVLISLRLKCVLYLCNIKALSSGCFLAIALLKSKLTVPYNFCYTLYGPKINVSIFNKCFKIRAFNFVLFSVTELPVPITSNII